MGAYVAMLRGINVSGKNKIKMKQFHQNYGYDLENYKDHPCTCGTESCLGYIVGAEFFPHLRRRQELIGDP